MELEFTAAPGHTNLTSILYCQEFNLEEGRGRGGEGRGGEEKSKKRESKRRKKTARNKSLVKEIE